MAKKVVGFCIKVEDRPGTLDAIADLMGKQGINIDGCSGISSGGKGIVYLIANNPQKATEILNKAGVKYEIRELLEVNVQDKPGELAKVTQALAEAKVNITALFITMQKAVVIDVDQIAQAVKALQKI